MTTTLLLHGGGGPATMLGLRAHLETLGAVDAPTHPGWDGTVRPDSLDSVGALADHYTAYLHERDLRDVLVVGSSVGGWLAAELALRDVEGRIAAIVLINAVGIDVAGQTIADVSGLTPPEIAQLSFHDPSALPPRPAPTPESLAVQAGNSAALTAYAGGMRDLTLLRRLGAIDRPALVVWGESDRVVTLAYGQAFAAAIPSAQFVSVPRSGHLPWIEQPSAVFTAIDSFIAEKELLG